MLRHNLREVCPNFHAYRVRFVGINFFLVDLVDDVALYAHSRENPTPNHAIPSMLRGFFEFADMFFEENVSE